METLPTELPLLPCYSNEKCGQVFNCGTPDNCSSITEQGTLANCPSGLKEEYCYGNNSNYCSGIYAVCDPNDVGEGIKCQPGETPAKTIYNQNLGCDLKTDSNCFEYEKFSPCQDTCWNNGGRIEAHYACESITDSVDCNGINFCKWIGNSCSSVSNDPSSNITTGMTTLSNGNKVYCAKSSYSGIYTTTQDDDFNIKTCCINDKCITTPRCEFVENTCDCVFKDLTYENNPVYNENTDKNDLSNSNFMCYDIIANYTSLDFNGQQVTKTKNGYCSWCSGTKLNKINNKSCDDRCSNLENKELSIFKFDNNSTDINTIPSSVYFNKCMNDIDPISGDTSSLADDFCVIDNLDPKVISCEKSYINYLKNISGCDFLEFGLNSISWVHNCQGDIINNFACGANDIKSCSKNIKVDEEEEETDISSALGDSILEKFQNMYGIHEGNSLFAFIIIISIVLLLLFIYLFFRK